MPLALEKKLKEQAAQHPKWDQRQKDRYVYGTLRRAGWRPARERKHQPRQGLMSA